MNILAIDPGIANTGVACNLGGTVLYETIKTSSLQHINISSRIREILFEIEKLSTDLYDLVVIEDFVGTLGRNTVFLIGAFLGHIYARQTYTVHPKVWVKEFFGKKKDYKKDAIRWCKKHGYKPATQHEADALCLLEWGKQKIC